MKKDIIKETNLSCDECDGEIIHDLVHDEKFCRRCGLILSAPYIHEEIE